MDERLPVFAPIASVVFYLLGSTLVMCLDSVPGVAAQWTPPVNWQSPITVLKQITSFETDGKISPALVGFQ